MLRKPAPGAAHLSLIAQRVMLPSPHPLMRALNHHCAQYTLCGSTNLHIGVGSRRSYWILPCWKCLKFAHRKTPKHPRPNPFLQRFLCSCSALLAAPLHSLVVARYCSQLLLYFCSAGAVLLLLLLPCSEHIDGPSSHPGLAAGLLHPLCSLLTHKLD